ncbi:hypothetical protein AAG906_028446 [Vitis piasezkii]
MASDSNFVQAAIPHFDGHYDHWSMLMENFLQFKEYWPIVESGIQAPYTVLSDAQKTELEGRKLKDLKAKNYLFQAIDRPILETILSKETSKDIWDSMKKKYEGSARVKRAQLQALRRDFETLQMKDGESVTSYCARTMEISNKMHFHGTKMKDVTIVEKILHSLTPKFDYVVCSIEESKDIDTFSLDELVEVEVEEGEIEAIEMAASISKPMMVNFRAKVEDEINILINPRNLNLMFGMWIRAAVITCVEVMGKDDIEIRTKNGFVETISNVLYIPNLKSNLLSVGQLQEKGYVVSIEDYKCAILFGSLSKRFFLVVALSLWPLEFWWIEDPPTEKYGNTIKTLRTDHGGEYCSTEFEVFFAYIPQQNGVSRGKQNHPQYGEKLVDKRRIPKSFWLKRNWSIHILNEAWSGRKPTVDHFKIFGCNAYAHIPDEKRKKLDDKGEKCKLFNPLTKKIVTSRDVVFDEENT